MAVDIRRDVSCCFTGHRPDKLPWGFDEGDPRCAALKASIARELERLYGRGYRHFISGMAQGCDLYFAEAALALRERYPDVTVEGAVPCPTQADRWPEETGIWWTGPPPSWRCSTAPPAAPTTPSPTPWARRRTSGCWTRPTRKKRPSGWSCDDHLSPKNDRLSPFS